ncbi:MAG: hypothetical protein ACK5NF_03525, partial [Bacilli bacterium]
AATEKLKSTKLNMGIKKLFMAASKVNLITICIKFNGRTRINKEISKEDYDLIRGLVQTE